ncbi:hypothetical protein KJ656_17330 [bacterium]|nr:hypothetical protein [bacterium]
MINKRIFPLILVVFICEQLLAGIGSAAYQKLGMDARANGMGRTLLGFNSDASALFWNPANLCRYSSDDDQWFHGFISQMSQKEYDIDYISGGFVFRGEKFGFGAGIMNYRVADISVYDKFMNYNGNFDNVENTFFIGLASKIPYIMNFGVTFQYLDQQFKTQTSYSSEIGYNNKLDQSIGIRAGISVFPLYKYEHLVISMAFNNASFPMMNQTEADTTRPTTTAGIAWKMPKRSSIYLNNLLIAMEVEQEYHFPIKLKMGTEISVINLKGFDLLLRAGLDDIVLESRSNLLSVIVKDDITTTELRQYNLKKTIGFGLVIPVAGSSNNPINIRFDYAYVIEKFRTLNFISLGFML